MARTAALWRLHESATALLPSDATGNVGDLGITTGLTLPPVVESRFGWGREFSAGTGLVGTEIVADSTLLQRSMAIEVVLNSADPIVAQTGTHVLVARGVGGSDAERKLFGLAVVNTAGSLALSMFWETSGGAVASVPTSNFTPPEGSLYLAVVRRWISASSVEVDYFANGTLLGTVTSTDGGIGNGEGGTLTLGVEGDGAGGWQNHLYGVLDQVRISADERTAEEILATYRQLFVHPAEALELVTALLPPGEAYSSDPDSAVRRELTIEADALARAWGLATAYADGFVPSRTTEALERWETVVGLPKRPGDSYASRRARVTGHLRRVHGYQRSEILTALYELLDCTEDDLEIIENSTRLTDDFEDGTVGASWLLEERNGSIAETGGVLRLGLLSGNDATWDGTTDNAVRARIHTEGTGVEVAAEITTGTLLVGSAGVFLLDSRTGDAILCEADATETKVVSILGGVLTVEDTIAGLPPHWLRILDLEDGTFRAGRSTDGDYPWSGATVTASLSYDSVGVFVRASGLSDETIDIDAFRVWMPKARRPFDWYVYRDPALGGTPDIDGAQLTLNRLKPAHTNGTVTESRALICDSILDLCDRTPLE